MARFKRATSPRITTKRLPVSLLAVAKSRPLFRPSATSTWSFTSKSNWRGSPHREISTLSSSSLPSGTDSSGKLGIPWVNVLISSNNEESSALAASSSSPSLPTSARSGAMSSPCAFALPMDLLRTLRSFCRSCVLDWSVFLFSSRELKAATSRLKPRAASRLAVCSISLRKHFGSNMCF